MATPDEKDLKEDEKGATVTVSKAKLEKILDRIDRLESAASKAGLNHWDEKHKETGGKVVNLGMLDGKVVISFVMTKNRVEKNEKNIWIEEQEIESTLEDGDTIKMPYVFWIRRLKHLPCLVKGEEVRYGEEGKNGKLFHLESKDGRKYDVEEKFVNP